MRLFDSFKKKKYVLPLKELEIPPVPDDQEILKPQEVPEEFSSIMAQDDFSAASPQMQQELQRTPDFPLPKQREMSEQTSFGFGTYDEVPMPFPEETEIGSPVPQFKFYQEAPKEEHDLDVPFDVSQELLSIPEIIRQEKKQKAEEPAKQQHLHFSKQFITVASLYEVGEQLIHFNEDISLAKDTAFRLTDLNEQEIEQMAKWQTLQHSIELRLAEIDKILFKA